MTLRPQLPLLAAALALTFGNTAWALDPAPIDLTDGIKLTPTLKLGLGHDDNFRAVETNEQSSMVSTIAPSFKLGADSGKARLEASYTAHHEIYHSSREDDNTDHLLGANAEFRFNARNNLRLGANYRKVEETASADQEVENDRYNTTGLTAHYTYGAPSATGQIRLGLTHDRLRYDNGVNPATDDRLNADKERDSTGVSSAFLYRVAPKTKALIEARHTTYSYESNTSLDSANTALLLGAEWEATAFTTGSARIGRERKDFDDAGKDDSSTGMVELGISWAPLTYSSFSLNARQGFDEGSDGANAIEARSWTLGWEHDWTDQVSTKLTYAHTTQDYDRPSDPREDKLESIGFGVTYKMRRWLDVGVGYKYTENDSDQPTKSYKRNVIGVTLNASL